MKKLLIIPIFILLVKITEDIPYITTTNSSKEIRVDRIQDTNNRLTDDYNKTSRPSPQPTKVADVKKIDLVVKITEDIPYITTTNSGKEIRVDRIQDTNNRLTDDYSKTSRPCPPFCIQPTKVADGVKNIAELELLKFMQNEVPKGRGVVIDARLKSWFKIETIPSAINIPFTAIENGSRNDVKKIFQILGMKIKEDGDWDFTNAKKLAIFCNGMWCEQSRHLINAMIAHGYPEDKMLYYRDGFQGWKLLGLTTVVHDEKEIIK